MKQFSQMWHSIAEHLPNLTIYQRFESLVALILTLLVMLVIAVALFRLSVEIVGGLVIGALNPLEHGVFQAIFGQIMTVLIALEFNHTLRFVVAREQSIIQTKTVLLISLLAMARRFIIMDLTAASSVELLGLAAVTLALGAPTGSCANGTTGRDSRRRVPARRRFSA
jgi:uncharacterized membrane protein (DUF373 family)